MMTKEIEMLELHKDVRGYDFIPEGADWPTLYATEDVVAGDKIVQAHFFIGASSWFLVEYDPDRQVGFGWCVLNGDLLNAEWGYFSIYEIENLRLDSGAVVHRDLIWVPKAARDVLPVEAWGRHG